MKGLHDLNPVKQFDGRGYIESAHVIFITDTQSYLQKQQHSIRPMRVTQVTHFQLGNQAVSTA